MRPPLARPVIDAGVDETPGQSARGALVSAGSTGAGMRTASKTTKILVCLALGILTLVGCAHQNANHEMTPTGMVAALAPPPPPEPASEYRIQSGDELHVRFTYQPDMNEQIPV